MDCPICQSDVDLGGIAASDSEEFKGLEITFSCVVCCETFFTIVDPTMFVEAE